MECCSGWSAHIIVTSWGHTNALQLYRHPSSIQYQNTSPATENTSPETPKQVQAPKNKSRHPATNPDTQKKIRTSKQQVQTSQ